MSKKVRRNMDWRKSR